MHYKAEHAELEAAHAATIESHEAERTQMTAMHAAQIAVLDSRLQEVAAEALRLARRSNAEWETQLAAVEAERARLLAAQVCLSVCLSVCSPG